MKNNLFIFSFFIFCFPCISFAQEDRSNNVLHIYDEEGFANSDIEGQFHYLISINSPDSLFDRDGYKFFIPNKSGFDDYLGLQEIGEKVSLDSLNYIRKSDLAEFSNCELHNFLSLKKKIYVIFKREQKFKGQDAIYWMYPIIYEGTQKNIEMMRN